MGISDKLKQLGDKAKEAAAEHKDQISQAVENAGVIADRRTGGKYRDKIAKATERTGAYVERLAPEQGEHADAERGEHADAEQGEHTDAGQGEHTQHAEQTDSGSPPSPPQ